jgi:hypothetical protein
VSTEGQPYREIGFESSFLGAGQAILSPDDDGMVSALVRTDAGVTVHVFGQSLDPETLQAAIEQDHLVDIDAESARTTEEPVTTTSTTVVAASTTLAPDTSGGELSLVGIERSVTDQTETIEIEFDQGIPRHELWAVQAEPVGNCAELVGDHERLWTEDGHERYWNGWMTIEVDAAVATPRGAMTDRTSGFLVCDDGEPPRVIAIPVESLAEPEVTSLSGRPVLRIDLAR